MWRRVGIGVGAVLLIGPAGTFGALYWSVSHPRGDPLPLPPISLGLDTAPGRALLAAAVSAGGAADHEALMGAFQTQEKGSWCGVASAVAVLGAEGRPTSQEGLFTDEASEVRSFWRTTFGGMPIDHLAGLLDAHGVTAEARYADDESLESFRAELARNGATPGDWLIVNYDRRVVDEAGGGHISPVSAYDAATDRLLLLDTASYKYPAHWVPAEAMFRAMDTPDSESGRSRGWVVVR